MVVLRFASMGTGLPGPGGADLLASSSQAQSPELTRWVPTAGAPSRSWDIRELTVHAAINASTPPGGPQGGADELLTGHYMTHPAFVFGKAPGFSCRAFFVLPRAPMGPYFVGQ